MLDAQPLSCWRFESDSVEITIAYSQVSSFVYFIDVGHGETMHNTFIDAYAQIDCVMLKPSLTSP